MEFKVFWSKGKNIPIIVDEEKDMIRIKTENLTFISNDLRPVFIEEKHLLKMLFEWDESIYYKSIWATKQGKYIIDGVLKKESFIKHIKKIENIEKFREKILEFNPDKKMKNIEETIFENFIKENREHLYYLLHSEDIDEEGFLVGAYPFIEKAIEIYKNRIPMVSFSGGKDSTVVSHLVRKGLNNQEILHIFGDTTLELPDTYKYVQKFKEENIFTPFFDERNEENDFFQMCKEIGPPSRVKSWCCSIFKTGPMGTTLSNFDEEFLTFYGVRRKESASRSKYKKLGKTPKIHGGLVTSPIIDWLDIEVWLYILSENIMFNKAYKKGFSRVGCWMCPNNSDISQFLSKIYVRKDSNPEINFDSEDWESFLYEFGEKIVKNYYIKNKIDIDEDKLKIEVKEYVEKSKWKARQGGEGLEKSKDAVIRKKECVNEKNSFLFQLNRNIDTEFITLFKPFGNMIFINKKEIKEVIILNSKEEALFKLLYKDKEREVRVTLIDIEDKYLFGKIVKQLNKFNTCIYCQACNSTCSFGAISVTNGKYEIDENKCVHCLNCITKFESGCLVASALKIRIEDGE